MTVSPQPVQTLRPVQASAFGLKLDADSRLAGSRRATLLLHSLRLEDREWLLAQLDPADRAELDGLLAELESLGIQGDAALVAEALGEVARPSPAPRQLPLEPLHLAAPPEVEPAALVAAAAPEVIASLLRDEPPGLVAALLECRAWPWRADVLAQLGAYQRLRVEELLERGARELGADHGADHQQVPQMLGEHLVSSLAARLEREAGQPGDDKEANSLTLRPIPRLVTALAVLLGRLAPGGLLR